MKYTINPDFDLQQNISGAIIYIEDISAQKVLEQTLIDTTLYSSTILDNIPQGFILFDHKRRIIKFNKNAFGKGKDLFGVEIKKGELFLEHLSEKERSAFMQDITCALLGSSVDTEHSVIGIDGNQYVLEITYRPVLDKKNKVVSIIMVMDDVTQKKNIEIVLKSSEERFRLLAQSTTDFIYECNMKDDSLEWFGNISELLKVPEDLKPKNLREWLAFIHPEDKDRVISTSKEGTKEKKTWARDYRIINNQGEIIHLHGTGIATYDEKNKVLKTLGTISNISTRKLYEEQLKYLSMHDQLTGLYNRAFFDEELKRLNGSREYPVTIIAADLDGLKLINDTMGHAKGDQLIQACANILQKSVRNSDILARTGGDEFVAILPRSDTGIAKNIDNRIQSFIYAHNCRYPSLPISISIGTATAFDSKNSLEEINKKADNSMYRHKLSNKIINQSRIVDFLMYALGERDCIFDGHGVRVSSLCLSIGMKLGINQKQLGDLALLAQVHDLGNVGIPTKILYKKGTLNKDEMEVIQQHPEKGHRIALSSSNLSQIADMILMHQEKWDGSGYPLGLKGKNIPIECRILAIADAYDVMTNDRPYRKALSKKEAIEELNKLSGIQFDPQIIKLFLTIVC